MSRSRTIASPPTRLTEAQLARRIEIGEERRARTRKRVIEAAYRLFAERGADAPTIDDIIAEAGVARGTFYNHFQTRDECFQAVADEIATAINALILPQIEHIEDPALRIALAFRLFTHFGVADETRGWILLRMMPLVGALNHYMKTFVEGEFADGIGKGRFQAPSLAHAVDLGLGLEIMTIHRMLVDRCDDGYADLAAEMLLMALGLEEAEAREIATRPIDYASVAAAIGAEPPSPATPARGKAPAAKRRDLRTADPVKAKARPSRRRSAR